MVRLRSIILLLTVSLWMGCFAHRELALGTEPLPKNVVLFIVDGMGFKQLEASRIFWGNAPWSFEHLPIQTRVTTHNAINEVTDSAAAATAMATGTKVINGTISRQIPGDGHALPTLLERFSAMGKSTGLITTSMLTDATPAAFGAHSTSRTKSQDILSDYLERTKPNIIMGADEPGFKEKVVAANAGYLPIHTLTELNALHCDSQFCPKIYGGFGSHELAPGQLDRVTAMPLEIAGDAFFQKRNLPHLSQMVEKSLEMLEKNNNGFFLMVESGLVDWIGHKNQEFSKEDPAKSAVVAVAYEMKEVDNTFRVIERFAANNPDTLVIMTADHETGGLEVDAANTSCLGQQNCVPTSKWTSTRYEEYKENFARHTGVPVPLFAKGPRAQRFSSLIDNTDISKLILND